MHRLDRVGRDGERAEHAVERDLLQLDAGQAHLQHFDQAAQARIGRELRDQRFRLRELLGDLLGLLGRQEQQARCGGRTRRRPVARCLRIRSLFWLSRSTSAVAAWLASSGVGASTTARIECRCCGNACSNARFALAPRQIRRNQLVDVGIDGEMLDRIDARNHPQDGRQSDHQPRPARAAGDDRDDGGSKHTFE